MYCAKNIVVNKTKEKKRPCLQRVYTLVFGGYGLLLLFSHKAIITTSLNDDNTASSRCLVINGQEVNLSMYSSECLSN